MSDPQPRPGVLPTGSAGKDSVSRRGRPGTAGGFGACRLRILGLIVGGLSAWALLDRFAPIGRHVGVASWYGPGFYGRQTASGAVYTGAYLTAAHRSLPFGTRVRVTNLENGRRVVVVVDDRGPYARGRVIDLSPAAARRLGMLREGLARVRVEVVGLSRSLGMRVVAEGVETTEQADWLRLQGCDSAQGFLFSEPMPAEAVPAWLRRGSRTVSAAAT